MNKAKRLKVATHLHKNKTFIKVGEERYEEKNVLIPFTSMFCRHAIAVKHHMPFSYDALVLREPRNLHGSETWSRID